MSRQCRECIACCFFTNGAGSATYVECVHCNGKCDIYAERPPECKTFECLWLKNNQVPESLRPDRCGVMFEAPYGTDVCVGHISPDTPDAWKTDNVSVFIRKIVETGHSVVIYDSVNHVALAEGDTLARVEESLIAAKTINKET